MNMMKKFAAAFCALALAVTAVPGAAADYSPAESRDADVLYTLGLVQGTEKGYELYRSPTRAEALVMAVRLAGGENAAGEYSSPFSDVPAWADRQAGYAYANGIINGVAADTYGFAQPASQNDYATMLLRILGYSDTQKDFSWEESAEFAAHLGIKTDGSSGNFTRADMFAMTCDALSKRLKSGESTLLERLVEQGEVDSAKANATGMTVGGELDGAEIYERCIDAVFSMTFYENEAKFQMNEAAAYASGFFVSADGVAVSNYHAFSGSSVAVVTLNSGEKYRVTDILSFDKLTDLVVFRVSKTSLDKKNTTSFAYLEYLCSDEVKNGETVYAIGSPLTLSGTITSGIVSYKNREVEGFANPMIQNTAAISQGNSGGVLVNASGKAIGSTCAYFISGQSLNLAIPLDILFELDFSGEGCSIAEMNRQVEEQEKENGPLQAE